MRFAAFFETAATALRHHKRLLNNIKLLRIRRKAKT